MNAKLMDAVSIFKELGWAEVTAETVQELPIGTKEQKQTALAGLKSGEWGEIAEIKKNTYGWRSFVDVDEWRLALYAVRVGVDARRAASMLKGGNNAAVINVIAGRGAKYALDFIGFACNSRRRLYEHSASVFGSVAVQLVHRLDLEIPQTVEYMKDWSVYAAAAMGLSAEVRYQEEQLPGIELIEQRFAEHIRIGVAVNAPATGPFGAVLPAGVKRGWIDREQAVDLVFTALDAAVRPGDRKVWLAVLDELEISDEELGARIQALIPLLAMGDVAVITRLAPVLIARADDDVLAEVLMAAFSATTKKARVLVLRAALNRPCPANAEELASWFSMFADDADKTVAALAAKLMKQWNIDAEAAPEEAREIRGCWQQTPPVWSIPSFELGEISPEALTDLAAELVGRPELIHDVLTERFLAMANAVACQDPEAARASLRGLRSSRQLLDFMVCWVKGEQPRYGFDQEEKDKQQPLTARDYMVCLRLGELPCLLSTPSTVDLSVKVPDLAARLAVYKETGTDVLEADLFLALTRLDLTTNTPEAGRLLEMLDLPIVLQSGEHMDVNAGQAVLTYLDNPIKEPLAEATEYGYWGRGGVSAADSLCGFPDRFAGYQSEFFSIFPLWGDAALRVVRWNGEFYHDQGLNLRQVVRRATPLPPGAAINLLAAQRSMAADAAEDSMLAVTEAWERGLLRPGVTDAGLLDWSSSPPSNLAALSVVLDGVARDGMLSVVWPIVDALIEASLKAPRLLAGTAELAGVVAEFLPEVQHAIRQGLADDAALDLPGIRALAQRGGSSRAVTTAKKIVELLPPVTDKPGMDVEEEKDQNSRPVMDPAFDEVWPEPKAAALLIDDGGVITVEWANPDDPSKLFLFTLKFPDITDRAFQIVNGGWYYDLEREGQCRAQAVAPDTTTYKRDKDNEVWLHWDTEKATMAVCDNRNWVEGKDGPLSGGRATPLSSSLLIVIIGLLAQDGDAVYYAPRLLRDLIERGKIDAEIVRQATKTLIQSPVVSPAKLVRVLEKDIKLLPVLWPMLTELIKSAGARVASGEAPPVWVNRVLDIALRHAPYLAEAADRGLIPAEDARWQGLAEIASAKSKSTAVAKAKKLITGIS